MIHELIANRSTIKWNWLTRPDFYSFSKCLKRLKFHFNLHCKVDWNHLLQIIRYEDAHKTMPGSKSQTNIDVFRMVYFDNRLHSLQFVSSDFNLLSPSVRWLCDESFTKCNYCYSMSCVALMLLTNEFFGIQNLISWLQQCGCRTCHQKNRL